MYIPCNSSQATLEASHRAELQELEERYLSRAGQIGLGHRNARVINEVSSGSYDTARPHQELMVQLMVHALLATPIFFYNVC